MLNAYCKMYVWLPKCEENSELEMSIFSVLLLKYWANVHIMTYKVIS